MELPKDLREALDSAVTGTAERAAVERLIETYREGVPAAEPILATESDVAAYAAYRMPATYAAVRTALAHTALAVPTFTPTRHLDLGGGTGAAAWAAAETFASLSDITVLDQVPAALALGRRLAGNAYLASMRDVTWREGRVESDALPPADLVTLSYVVNELPSFDAVVRRAAEQAEMVVVIEPGTPAGFERIRVVRALLVEAGLRLVAPCPQSGACPIVAGRDWCHFAARIGRSALHRRLKGGDLSYEDEKFSYVAAARSLPGGTPGRVLRRPQLRKGLVSMSLCTPEGSIRPELVSKRQGTLYRAARDVDWGDSWPPDLA